MRHIFFTVALPTFAACTPNNHTNTTVSASATATTGELSTGSSSDPATTTPATTSPDLSTTDGATGEPSGSETAEETELPETETDESTEGESCTNGVLDEGELCDDGLLSEQGPCLPGCMPNICGDGYLHQGVEACDAGDQNGAYAGSCDLDCQTDDIPHCGDGVLQEEFEACEPGEINGDGVLCNAEQCGWGLSRFIFLTSHTFTGSLETNLVPDQMTGLARADAICQTLADSADLPGAYYAWLSDNNHILGFSNAVERIGVQGGETVYYVMPMGGAPLAHSWDSFLEEGPAIPIAHAEDGMGIGGLARVWSNTSTSGVSLQLGSCGNWTSTNGFGRTGYSKTGPGWTDEEDYFCLAEAHLYCVEGQEN